MNSRSKYKTKQRDEMLSYLESMPGVHITANEVYEHFTNQGENIGQSTVYRQLESLVDEGLLNKYIIDIGSPACFEYVDPASHGTSGTCFHCKCEKCGKLIHLHCEEMKQIMSHLREDHGFTINPVRTVFYGLCADCSKALQA